MKRYAVVYKGKVENVILWDGECEYTPAQGHLVEAPDEVGPGWRRWNGEWKAPSIPENPNAEADADLLAARERGVAALVALGVDDADARMIVGF